MHSIRYHTFPLLLLLAAFSVTAANAFIPRRQRRYLTDASRPSIGSSSQSLHERDATLPFGLQLRGGDADGDVASKGENGEETVEEAAESGVTAKKVWEEEIKRTQSFYQEQSASDASESVDDGANNVEDANSEATSDQSDTTVDVIEGDDSTPAQANEDIVDVVEGEADAEDNNTDVVDAVDDVSDEALQEATEAEVVAENEAQDEVSEEEEAETLQVEVVTEGQTSDSEEVGNVDAEDVIISEEAQINDTVEESVATEEGEEGVVAAEEEVLEGDTVGEEQSTADDQNAGSDGAVDSSVTPLGDTSDDGVAEVDTDTAATDESSESTPEQDASSIAVSDEPTSLVRKVSAVVQVMLLRGRIAVSKNKGVQYLAQNKPKIKVIALASLGGVLSLLVGGHVFLAMQETDVLELPNDDWIEEESYVDEADEDDNDY
mmetsp:Transcript_34565/g.51804  ORF Transcript_34565/g.51804 Transcript_34565/m.51804 type:complete len:435 (+) Transcript_34565:60-1364(+)